MYQIESTGFNLDRFDVSPLGGIYTGIRDLSIFYNFSIDKPEHIGLLLAELEKRKLIRQDQVTFGTKATKVIWEWDPKQETESLIRVDGSKKAVGPTVEVVVKINSFPQEDEYEKFIGILDYFSNHVYNLNTRPPHIPESWEAPDIRILTPAEETDFLEVLAPLITADYVLATQNELSKNGGRILALREKASFAERSPDGNRWNSQLIIINRALHAFLGQHEVGE